ncbi:MAG: hypothetical protein Q4A84_06700 [Neisseria sp.]|uniref:DUF58 domain-containing protein n=1 Tax=Neisseria sp. TaxID=192066 RepID=UPI0026DBC708|nr:DUF58 domain-containing protein [Neisseria sp.]MDO4641375.1 hypothetical protein [Neisseria sp.]
MSLFNRQDVVIPATEPVAVGHFRLRPTRFGVGILVAVGLLWLVGLQYQVNLAYAVAFWLLGFMVIAVLLNIRQLSALKTNIRMPDEIFAGMSADLALYASSENKRNRWLWLCTDSGRHQENSLPVWQNWIIDSQTPEPFIWQVVTLRRGYLHIPVLQVATIAPFGLSMLQTAWQFQTESVVYPAPIEHQAPQQTLPDGEEDPARPRIQGGDELAYLQVHQAGTSLQHVAWKTYAKTGEMLDKRFEEPQAALRNMVISYRDYPAQADKDRLAGLLCYRVLEAERSNLPYILELPHQTVMPQKGQREIALTALALL